MTSANKSHSVSSNLKIEPVETQASEIKSPPLMDKIGLRHPFSLAFYGASSSGKTVALVNLFTKPQMYGNFFDEIWLWGPTGKCDDSFKSLNIPDKRVVTKDYISRLDDLLKTSKEEVEKHGLMKAKKRAIIFEDLTSLRKLMSSESFCRCYVQVRHHNMSVAASCHKYNALERTSRLNSKHHMAFPACKKELMRIVDEHIPAHISPKEFINMINHAWMPEADNPRPFFWIKAREDVEKRFSKSLNGQYTVRGFAGNSATKNDSSVTKKDSQKELEEPSNKRRKLDR